MNQPHFLIIFVFSADPPTKKHRPDEQSESARRGELSKSQILTSGDKRAPSIVKRSFTIGHLYSIKNSDVIDLEEIGKDGVEELGYGIARAAALVGRLTCFPVLLEYAVVSVTFGRDENELLNS